MSDTEEQADAEVDAAYHVTHRWLWRNYPKSGVCDQCGAVGKTDYAYLAGGREVTRERADYAELCRPCHRKHDGARAPSTMSCPECGARTEVTDTRPRREWTTRRRRCPDCGLRFTTREVIVSPTTLRTVANRPLRQ